MKTSELIKNMSDVQIEIAFILLGIYFNKHERVNSPSVQFIDLSKLGRDGLLKDCGVSFSDEFTVNQIMDLLKIQMLKRGIE